MLIKAGIAAVITLAIIATSLQISLPPRPRVLYNPSPSAPMGWYRLAPQTTLNTGDRVAAFAPDWARKLADARGYLPFKYPLIKSVMAVSGEKVCYHTHSVSVPNGVVIPLLVRDRSGRDMPKRFSGCLTLEDGDIWIASPDVQTGFDSRYFGQVSQENVLGKVVYLGNIKDPKTRKIQGFKGE